MSTTVTGTVTDTDGNAWAGGTWVAQFYPTQAAPGLSGQGIFFGTLDGSGALSTTLPLATPSGGSWQFTIKPNASSPAVSAIIAISGASQSISAQLSAAAIGPRFHAGPTAYGYADVEVILPVSTGQTYYNVTTPALKVWTGSAWAAVSGGGSGTVTSVSGTANQIDVATGTTTPVLSLDNAITLPGSLTVPSGGSIAVSGTGTVEATAIGVVAVTGVAAASQVLTATSSSAAHWATPSGGSGNFVNIGSAVTFAMGGGGAGSFSGGAFTVTTPGTSITISSIPGTYLNLKLVGVLQGNASTQDGVSLQFNGDSGDNYDYSFIYGGGSLGASGNHGDGQSSAVVAFLADSGQVAHYPSPVEILIPTYAGTTFWKTFLANSMRNSNGNPDFDVAYIGGGWHNTAAITSITLFPNTGPNFTAGSTISIYGLN